MYSKLVEEERNFWTYNFYVNGKKIGLFSFEYLPKSGSVSLEAFEIFDEYQGQGFSKHMAEEVKKVFKERFPETILHIEAIPYDNEPLSSDQLTEIYLRYFEGSMEVRRHWVEWFPF